MLSKMAQIQANKINIRVQLLVKLIRLYFENVWYTKNRTSMIAIKEIEVFTIIPLSLKLIR